jgi:hypothetical protein
MDADPARAGFEPLREAIARRFDESERAFLGKS